MAKSRNSSLRPIRSPVDGCISSQMVAVDVKSDALLVYFGVFPIAFQASHCCYTSTVLYAYMLLLAYDETITTNCYNTRYPYC